MSIPNMFEGHNPNPVAERPTPFIGMLNKGPEERKMAHIYYAIHQMDPYYERVNRREELSRARAAGNLFHQTIPRLGQFRIPPL